MNALAEIERSRFFREFGLSVERAEPGFARVVVRHDSIPLRGVRNGLNGGILASLTEVAMRACLAASVGEGERPGPIRELTINYLSAARGETTHVDARMVRKGRRLAVGTVEVIDAATGAVCSIAQITCAVLSE